MKSRISSSVLALLCAFAFGGQTHASEIGNEIPIPPGYRLVAIAASGFMPNWEFYCQSLTDSEEFVVCNGGIVGDILTFPEGYVLVDAANSGYPTNSTTFFCRLEKTERVFQCVPDRS